MGFLSGSLAFQRLRVSPAPGRSTLRRVAPRPCLRELCRRPGGEGRLRRRVRGGLDGRTRHVFDTDFTQEKNVYPDHLASRTSATQANKPPADRLKAYYATELKALSKDNPSGFASARQKREAKEIARERIHRRPRTAGSGSGSASRSLWDAGGQQWFYGATAPTHLDRFLSLWEQTFCRHARPGGTRGETRSRHRVVTRAARSTPPPSTRPSRASSRSARPRTGRTGVRSRACRTFWATSSSCGCGTSDRHRDRHGQDPRRQRGHVHVLRRGQGGRPARDRTATARP
jgi:hypothetical protein